jgi:alpha-galactosidase
MSMGFFLGELLMRSKLLLMLLVVAMAFIASTASAATMSASLTAPVIDRKDIANYSTSTTLDKFWLYPNSKGQTFTTGDKYVNLNAISYLIADSQKAEPTKTYAVRVGTVDVGAATFTEIRNESATQNFTWNASEYMTWTFDAPVLLAPNTEYGIDVGMTSSSSIWQTGIPYLQVTGDLYSGGTRYISGVDSGPGIGDATITTAAGDRIFHLDMEHPMRPLPTDGADVPAGDVDLSWTNLDPNEGVTDVYVDVYFGTDPNVSTLVPGVSGIANINTATVNAPVANTYYWRVDSHLDGSPTGPVVKGQLFVFYVTDSDGDGLPDEYELLYTDPCSPTAMNPGDDEEPDGLTNMEEYNLGTNPIIADTDGDTLLDGPELDGVDLRPPTDPLNADTDGDGIDDDVETNTGTYVSAADTGTDPTNADTDTDGLTDGVETNTGTFVDETDTGTDPTVADSDSDGAGDWYEIAASYTNPTDPEDAPLIPYPLPDPDGSTGATDKPVKVYILSGQSNMVGMGHVNGTALGTLETIAKRGNKFPNLVDDAGQWTVRNDVMYRGVITALGNGLLTPGVMGSNIGPEMGFGQVMGYYHDEPVIVLKSSQGNRSISWDFAPPSTARFDYGDLTYGGYGDSPGTWPVGTTKPPAEPGAWYAGKQWDDCFLDEADWAPLGSTQPQVENVVDVLDNFATQYPQYASQGFEIAGYAWWQGHKDQSDVHAPRYEQNMRNFISDLRDYYEDRYPDNIIPNAPFVLATVAFDGGWDNTSANYLTIAEGQLAVSDPNNNAVKTIEARGYWRDSSISPTGAGYHYNGNAETYMLVGDALGRAMVELKLDLDAPTPDLMTWDQVPEAGSTLIRGVGLIGDETITTTPIVSQGTETQQLAGLLNDPFAYDPDNPTSPMPQITWESTKFFIGTDTYLATIAYDFDDTYDNLFVDLYGRDSTAAIEARDDSFDVEFWLAGVLQETIATGIDSTHHVRVTASPGTQADSIRIIETAGSPNKFALAEIRVSGVNLTASSPTSITMIATTAADVSGVEYYFECTAGGGNDSSWQDSETYTDSGLDAFTEYTYRVQARDKSLAQNATDFSAEASATTGSACPTCGDLDGSGGDVDLADFGLFAACWGVDPTVNSSCVCANLVELGGNEIDLLDLQVLAELFLSSSPDYPPNNCSAN